MDAQIDTLQTQDQKLLENEDPHLYSTFNSKMDELPDDLRNSDMSHKQSFQSFRQDNEEMDDSQLNAINVNNILN